MSPRAPGLGFFYTRKGPFLHKICRYHPAPPASFFESSLAVGRDYRYMFCARVSRVLLGSQASKLVSACLLGFPQGLFSLRSVPYPVYSYSCITRTDVEIWYLLVVQFSTRTDVKQGEAIKLGFLERPSLRCKGGSSGVASRDAGRPRRLEHS